MVSRMNSKSGQRFWGCARFPDCRGTRNTDSESKAYRGKSDDDEYREYRETSLPFDESDARCYGRHTRSRRYE